MSRSDLTRLSAVDLAARLQSRDLMAREVIEAYLARIADREPLIHAWADVDPERALAQARVLDEGPIVGPLHGLPVGVKDIIDTADFRTEYGSPIYRGHRPERDAACVASVRAVGGIVLGKTTTTEFATFSPTPTVNPHGSGYTPGGSSSGSAAAVADQMVPLAFGTQTLGSIIRPASYCGVVGYKPSFGTLDRLGTKVLAESLDTIGVIARTVSDAALLVGGMTGQTGLMTGPLDRHLRVGVCRTRDWERVGPEVHGAMDMMVRALETRDVELSSVDLPEEFAAVSEAGADIFRYELARSLAHERNDHGERLSGALRELLDSATVITHARYQHAIAIAKGARAKFPSLMVSCDVLLTPSTTGEAPAGLASTGSPVMNALWTLLHLPCVNVPVASGPNGLPVGLQVVGHFGGDANTLRAAHWMMSLV